MVLKPRVAGVREAALELLCLATLLAPLAVCLAADVIHTSLWLDEVTYYYDEGDPALRAAEVGRPGRALAPYLGVFFHSDVQRLLHAAVRTFGLTLRRDPEVYLRFSSVLWYGVGVLGLYAFLRFRHPRRLDALLGALALGSTPIVLHYAFEARVYAMTLALVILSLVAVDAAARRPSPVRLALAGLLGLLTVHSHLWTLCLFAALLGVSAVRVLGARSLTPFARAAAAAAIPALALVGAETLYLKATDPLAPLFPPFGRQSPAVTLWHLVFSNFTGVRLTMFIGDGAASAVLQLFGGVALLGLAWISLRAPAGEPAGFSPRDAMVAALGSLFLCWLLAVTYGYYMPARYSVPLMGAFFFAAAIVPSRAKRLLFALFVVCSLGLLPQAIDGIRAKGSMKQVAGVILGSGTRDVAVVSQHVVAGGFPLPAQAIVLDFYLNVLHPDEAQIPIHELPDLALVNGRRGVYDLFAGGAPALEHYLRSLPDLWREARDRLGPRVFLVQQAWNIEAGTRQSREFARVLTEGGDREVVARYAVPAFPPTLLVETRRRAAR